MTELEKKAFAYATKRQEDPNYPVYNWETEISDAYEQGYKDATNNPTGGELLHVLNKGRKIGYKEATERAVEFIYAKQLAVPNIERLINELKKYMEEQQ